MRPIYRTDVPLQYSFYIFSQQIYLIIFLDFISPSSFIPPQNAVYFLMLPFLIIKIFTFYRNGVLNCKCPAPGPKGIEGGVPGISKGQSRQPTNYKFEVAQTQHYIYIATEMSAYPRPDHACV